MLVTPGMAFRKSGKKYFLFRSSPELPVSSRKKPVRPLIRARTNMSPLLSTKGDENAFGTFVCGIFQSGTGSIVRMRCASSKPIRIIIIEFLR